MRGPNPTRRRPADSLIPQPTPDHYNRQYNSRDSDASFASSRPSTIGAARSNAELYSDRSYQTSVIRAINGYLTSQSSNHTLRTHPTPSAKDITETLTFLLQKLDYPILTKLEDEIFLILKSLNCPFKVNKSTLKAPNTPHNWPSYLGLMHWLLQICLVKEGLEGNSGAVFENETMLRYTLQSYTNFLRGDDDAVEMLDIDILGEMEKERETVSENLSFLDGNVKELEARCEALKAGPTEREKLESLRSTLEEDVNKFNSLIAEVTVRNEALNRDLEEKKVALETKVEEMKRIIMENEELKKRVEEQSFNARDAERMKKELQVVERDISEAESARNSWEEKIWDLDTQISHKFKELETLAMDCNQAVRRLKLVNGFQYVLNAKGSTPAEVMGIDYKSVVKPRLVPYANDVKTSSMAKLEESILLQQESSELNATIEGKKKHFDALQSHIDEVEAQLILLRKELEEFTRRCMIEAQKLAQDVQGESCNLDNLEREAANLLKNSELDIQEAMTESEEEIQMQARQLFAVVDSVSKYKEHMGSKILVMKSKLTETSASISENYKRSLPAQFGINL